MKIEGGITENGPWREGKWRARFVFVRTSYNYSSTLPAH